MNPEENGDGWGGGGRSECWEERNDGGVRGGGLVSSCSVLLGLLLRILQCFFVLFFTISLHV